MRRLVLVFTLVAALLVPAVAAAAPVRLVGSSGDARLWRTRALTPLDPARSWIRRSAYALDSTTAAVHPGWVLKDSFGNTLYSASLPAADIGNPSFRAWWIAQASAAGGTGIYVDDVTMERRVYSAAGSQVAPRDPRTGRQMTEASWQRYMADFMVELRAALPRAEIVHDVLWAKGDTRADVVRELGAASAVALEGPVASDALAAYVERRRAAGTGVLLDAPGDPLFGLALALELDTAVADDAWTAPGRFWAGYGVDLGAPAGPRAVDGSLWRRDFADGVVLLVPPGGAARTVQLGQGYVDLGGVARTQVTLAGGTAAVLRRVPVTPPPPVTSGPPVAPDGTPAAPAASSAAPAGTAGRRSLPPRAHTAGAAAPKDTRMTVTLGRASVGGRVAGAVSGSVRVAVQRRRGGRWVTVRRAKDSVSKRGRYADAFAPLKRGSYRALARFEGTGTAEPSTASTTRALWTRG